MFSSLKKKDDDDDISFLDPAALTRPRPPGVLRPDPSRDVATVRVMNSERIELGTHDNHATITLHRTLRIPDDGKTYPLPPSMGKFPVCKVDDYKGTVPPKWLKHGGLFFPMYQREAMWMQFGSYCKEGTRPKAIKIGVGMVNAITGLPWTNSLGRTQDYVVLPEQPWIDGIKTAEGQIKQFVAMPLGKGYTVEGQVTGEEKFGGVQVICYDNKKVTVPNRPKVTGGPPPPGMIIHHHHHHPPSRKPKSHGYKQKHGGRVRHGGKKSRKKGKAMLGASRDDMASFSMMREESKSSRGASAPSAQYAQQSAPSAPPSYDCEFDDAESMYSIGAPMKDGGGASAPDFSELPPEAPSEAEAAEMGIAAGGSMSQKVRVDKYGYNSWDENKMTRTYIHIINSKMYKEITGKEPPPCPISASTYTRYGYPWFSHYDEGKHVAGVQGSSVLAGVATVGQLDQMNYATPPEDSVQITKVVHIPPGGVRDGDW